MGNAFLLIVVGLLIFYLVISDKWSCVEGFAGCVTGRLPENSGNVSLPNTINNQRLPQIITDITSGISPNINLPNNLGLYGF